MSSGKSSDSSPEYKTEYYLPAQVSLMNGDYNNAAMFAALSEDGNYAMQMYNVIQQKQNEAKLAEQKAEYEAQNQAQQEKLAQTQAASEQSANASQKASVEGYIYQQQTKANANAGNQTSGQVSGASTTRKTLQGYGGNDEDMQTSETWY